ncbi:tetratricopeptide repeat protein [Dysgonomonas sp. 511]|uniref:tetratricopeptide repeat protein n=1 Tax=Dysgonomonas sp. 511 TaxID=2302930 RepID=UPI0013D4DEBB|nr:tetratricopeptide repeat protein [Dysgonomonas sp. 511]NDV78890.1 tetratricopeptide repeat protein [Dysgonomonas sp. 511]
MKQFILTALFLFSIYTCQAQDSIPAVQHNDSVKVENKQASGNDANELATVAYNEGRFKDAIAILETARKEGLEKGVESSVLYYNLGNAYFRTNDMGNARLNYERAALLDPGDRDIKHNIEYMLTKIEDKILVADTFFLHTWFRAAQNLLSSNGWAILSVVSFLLLIGSLVLFFFSRNVFAKKTAFYIGLFALILVVFGNIFTFKQKDKIEHRQTAVIMSGTAPILSSPDINSKELFTLHPGTKVYVTKEDRSWLEIEIDNGHIGWVQREKLEII